MVHLLTGIRRRSARDRGLLAHAFVLHASVALLSGAVPFGRLDAWLRRLYRLRAIGADAGPADEDRILSAVATAGHVWPGRNTCLTEALTAQSLLRSRGCETALRIGVARDGARGLDAHAWLERGGRRLTRGPVARDYVVLTRTGSDA